MRRGYPLGDLRRHRIGGAAHQYPIALPLQRDGLDGADLFDGIGLDHPVILTYQFDADLLHIA